jgi:hypothetical protein
MDLNTKRPVLIYDDKCSSCTIFAKNAFRYSRGQIDCMGHYSSDGEKFRKLIFPPNYNETGMFWIITSNHAYGGRSGLLPLIGLIIKGWVMSIIRPELSTNRFFPGYCPGSITCNNKIKIKRTFNLLKSGKKLNIRFEKSEG